MKAMILIRLSLLSMTIFSLTGCGVVSHMMPTSKSLELTSDPTGARVTIAGGKSGITPCTLKVPSGEAITVVTAFKSGFRSSNSGVNWGQQLARSGRQLKSTGQSITAQHHFSLRRAPARKEIKKIKDDLIDLQDLDVRGGLAAGIFMEVERFQPVLLLLKGKYVEQTGGVFWPGTEDPFTGKAGGQDEQGRLRVKMMFADGMPHGETTTWHANGKVMTKAPYKHGWPEGKVEQWHPNGKQALEMMVVNRKWMSLKLWDEHGDPLPAPKKIPKN